MIRHSEMSWIPDQNDIQFYQANGWFVTPLILPEKVLAVAEQGIADFYAGKFEATLPEWSSQFDWKPEDGEVLRLNNYLSLQIGAIQQIVAHPSIGRTAALLAKTDAVRLYKDSLIFKPPARIGTATKVGWHTDRAYWRMCSSDEMLTAWIPFQDSDETNGSLAVVERTHYWKMEHDMRTFGNQQTESLLDDLENKFGRLPKKVLSVKRGQVSFHHCRLLHGSMENLSGTPRKVIVAHLQPDDNRYQTHIAADGKQLSHLNDHLCRKDIHGLPDYTDPEIFPELWRQV